MNGSPLAGLDLSRQQAVPPRKQRIIAPSTIEVIRNGLEQGTCTRSLRIVDVVNLTMYYVPLTESMATNLRAALDGSSVQRPLQPTSEDNAA